MRRSHSHASHSHASHSHASHSHASHSHAPKKPFSKRAVALAAGAAVVAAGAGYALYRKRRRDAAESDFVDDAEFSAEIDVQIDVDKNGETAGLPTEGRLPENAPGDFDKVRTA